MQLKLTQLVCEAIKTGLAGAHIPRATAEALARPACGMLSASSSMSAGPLHAPASRHVSAAISAAHQKQHAATICSSYNANQAKSTPGTKQAALSLTARSSQISNALPFGSRLDHAWHAIPQRRQRCICTSAAAYAAAPVGGGQPADSSQRGTDQNSGSMQAIAKFVSDQFLPLGLLASMALGWAHVLMP